MSNLIRPAAREALWNMRDLFLAVAVILFAIWWLTTFFSPVRWLGYAFLALGVMMAIGGYQRLRFHSEGDGPGTVKIVERRLAYFGPLTGGVIEMDDVTRLELAPEGTAHWVLTGVGGQTLEIPVNADGADALFDLFASLPDIKTETMLAVLSRTPDKRVIIWKRDRPLLH